MTGCQVPLLRIWLTQNLLRTVKERELQGSHASTFTRCKTP
jgi:hypothetical protein